MRRLPGIAPAIIVAALLGAVAGAWADDQQEIGADPAAPGSMYPDYAQFCTDGMAGSFPCSQVDLMAYLPHTAIGGTQGNDICGWTDPLTGQEYALVGQTTGTAIVDITVAHTPVHIGNLPTHTAASAWRDLRVFADHAFIVSEASGHGMQVFDLTQLRSVDSPPVTFSETAHYGNFSNGHNIAIDESTGFAYAVGTNTCSGGLRMIDIHDPLHPTFAGCFDSDGYTHDVHCVVYNGPDTAHVGKEICFSSNADTLTLVDLSNRNSPVMLSRSSYPGVGYVHQGWTTEDQRYFLLDDELDENNFRHNTRTYIWDISDLDNPFVSGIHTATTDAIDHDQIIRGEYVYQANYRAGLRVLHLTDLAQGILTEIGFFDVYPANDSRGFNGTWSVYPFFASGHVILNGIEQGLFVVRPNLQTPGPSPTPTGTPTRTPTATHSPSRSPTPTRTATSTTTETATTTPTVTRTATPTRTPSTTPVRVIQGVVRDFDGTFLSDVMMTLGGAGAAAMPTAPDGGYRFDGLALAGYDVKPGSSEAAAPDAADAAMILQAGVGLIVPDIRQTLACDASANGAISALDAALVLRRSIGLINDLPAAEACGSAWVFFPEPLVVPSQQVTQPSFFGGVCTPGRIAIDPLIASAADQDFRATMIGDCDATPGGGPSLARSGSPAAIVLRRPRIASRGGARTEVHVTGADRFHSLEATLLYDPLLWRAVRVRSTRHLAGAVSESNLRTAGEVRIAIASATPLEPAGALFSVEFAPRKSSAKRQGKAPHMRVLRAVVR